LNNDNNDKISYIGDIEKLKLLYLFLGSIFTLVVLAFGYIINVCVKNAFNKNVTLNNKIDLIEK